MVGETVNAQRNPKEIIDLNYALIKGRSEFTSRYRVVILVYDIAPCQCKYSEIVIQTAWIQHTPAPAVLPALIQPDYLLS